MIGPVNVCKCIVSIFVYMERKSAEYDHRNYNSIFFGFGFRVFMFFLFPQAIGGGHQYTKKPICATKNSPLRGRLLFYQKEKLLVVTNTRCDRDFIVMKQIVT